MGTIPNTTCVLCSCEEGGRKETQEEGGDREEESGRASVFNAQPVTTTPLPHSKFRRLDGESGSAGGGRGDAKQNGVASTPTVHQQTASQYNSTSTGDETRNML